MGVCDVLQLVVVICTLLFSMITAVYRSVQHHGHTAFRLHPAARWSQVWYVGQDNLFRAEQAVPRGRSRSFKAANGGGGGGRQSEYSWRSRRGEANEAYQ